MYIFIMIRWHRVTDSYLNGMFSWNVSDCYAFSWSVKINYLQMGWDNVSQAEEESKQILLK